MNTTLESVKLLIERRKNLIDELNRTNSQLVIGYEKCILEIVAGRLTPAQLSEVIVPSVPLRVNMRAPMESGVSSQNSVSFMSPSEMNRMTSDSVEKSEKQEREIQETQETQEKENKETQEIVEEHHATPETQENEETVYEITSTRTETTENQETQEPPLKEPKEPKESKEKKVVANKPGHPPNCPCEENNIAPPREIRVPLSTKEIEESDKYQRAKAQQDKNISDWIKAFNSKSDSEKRSFRDKYLEVLKKKLQEIIPLPNKDGAMQFDEDVKLVVQRKLNIEYYTRLLKVLQDYSINENKRNHDTKNVSELENLD